MEKVSFITYRSVAGVMQMHGKLAATKFLPEFLPAANCQRNVKKYQPIFFFLFLKTHF